MIDKLTKEQEEKVKEYYEYWLENGKSCTPLNKKRVLSIIKDLYKNMGYKEPAILFFNSPMDALIEACSFISREEPPKRKTNKVVKKTMPKKTELEKQLYNLTGMQYWSGYIAFYSYFHDVFGFKSNDENLFSIILNLIKETHFILPYENTCFVSERPLFIHINNGLLHCENGPAIQYKDGFSVYALNGVRVTKEIVETPANEMDPKIVLTEKNAEVRREIVRKIGINNVIEKLGAKSVEKKTIKIPFHIEWHLFIPTIIKEKSVDYELLNFDIIDGTFRPYLKMLNSSIGTCHVEGVHPSCDTVKKALAWRDGESSYEKPEALT